MDQDVEESREQKQSGDKRSRLTYDLWSNQWTGLNIREERERREGSKLVNNGITLKCEVKAVILPSQTNRFLFPEGNLKRAF